MPPLEAAVDERRVRGQLDGGLGDEIPRIGQNGRAELLALRLRGGRPDEHSIAARLVDPLDHEFFEVFQHVAQLGGNLGPERLDVVEQRLLLEVVADHVGNERIDALVIGDPRPNAVGEGHGAGPIGIHEPRHTEGAVRPERERIKEVVVDPPVDDVDPLASPRGSHENAVTVDEQVAALDQFDSHPLREKAVLEIGGVVHARAEQNDGGVGHRFGRDVLQHIEQGGGVVVVGQHVVVVEERRKDPLEHLPVLQHVAHARRSSGIVLEHEILAVCGPNKVRAADVDVNPARHVGADELPAEGGSLKHEPRGHHPIAEDVLLVVDVPEKEIERVDPLREPGLDLPPLSGRDDPRHRIHRPDPFDSLLGAIDRESDAVLTHRQIGHRLATAKVLRRRLPQPFGQGLIVGPGHDLGPGLRAEHLVIRCAEFVVGKQTAGHGGTSGTFGKSGVRCHWKKILTDLNLGTEIWA